jgi:protein TonB
MNFHDTHRAGRRNPTGIAVVVLLHVAAAFVALQGSKVLIHRAPESIVDVIPVPDTPPPPPPPPVPMPDLVPPPTTSIAVQDIPPEVPQMTPVDIVTRRIDEPPPPADTKGGTARQQPPAEQARREPVKVPPVVDAKACTRPEYPRNAQRNGDTGTVTLAFLIGTDGKVIESKVEKSSGSRELDRAAQAGLSLCRFQPGTVDGVPYQSWTRMQYVWNLDE